MQHKWWMEKFLLLVGVAMVAIYLIFRSYTSVFVLDWSILLVFYFLSFRFSEIFYVVFLTDF